MSDEPKDAPPPEKPENEQPKNDDPPKEDAPKDDAPNDDAPKDDPPKEDAPKDDVPKNDAPKDDAPKDDAPKDDPPKEDAPKDDAPKDDAPKDEAPGEEPKEDPEEIKKLEEELAAAEKALTEDREALDAASAEHQKETGDAADVKKEVKALEGKVEQLEKDKADKKKQEDELQGPYDRAVANRELKERAAALKEDISAKEAELADRNNTITDLKQELDSQAARYAKVKDSRKTFIKELQDLVEALRDVTAPKTSADDEAADEGSSDATNETPFDLIDYAGDLVLSRERELDNNFRLVRELDAIIALKTEMAEKLEKETNEAIDTRRKERHERIKEFVFAAQEERNTLQADIEEIRRVNHEQAGTLAKGQVPKKPSDPLTFAKYDSGSITQRKNVVHSSSALGGARLSTSRKVVPRKEPEIPKEQKALVTSNKEMQEKLNELLKEARKAHEDSSILARDTKKIENQRKQVQEEQAQSKRVLEDKIVMEVKRIKDCEMEACRFTDAIAHLSQVVRVTKSHTDRVRCGAKPLPVEE